MNDKKTSIIALIKILQEYSDENHILTCPSLLSLLDDVYGLKIERRTLYKNIEMLEDFGFDISDYSDNGKGYYLRDRLFEPSQVNLLCNAVHSSTFIPLSSSKELIDKLLSTQSKYFKNEYRKVVFVDNDDKKDNREFFLNVDVVAEAIKNKKRVSFDYTKYNLNKDLVNRRDKPYVVSPYYMIYKGEKVFLVGKSNNHDDFIHFRLDKIRNIKLLDDAYIELDKQDDPYKYAKAKLYMYHGDELDICIKCDDYILDDVIDIFGKSCVLKNDDDSHFIANVKSSRQGMIYLALQYVNYMEVLSPLDLRQEIKDVLKKGVDRYG